MTGILPNSIIFADRPYRSAGHVLTSRFIEDEWGEGSDSFAKDPPNATISVLGADGTTIDDAVVVLKSPKLDGTNLTFDVTVLEGDLAGAKGSAALFIDWFAVHGGGYHHGGWYGAAAVAGVRLQVPRLARRSHLLPSLLSAAGLRLLPLSALLLS